MGIIAHNVALRYLNIIAKISTVGTKHRRELIRRYTLIDTFTVNGLTIACYIQAWSCNYIEVVAKLNLREKKRKRSEKMISLQKAHSELLGSQGFWKFPCYYLFKYFFCPILISGIPIMQMLHWLTLSHSSCIFYSFVFLFHYFCVSIW